MTSVFSWREAIQLSKLKPTTRLVLFNLSFRMWSKGGYCYPSIKTQAAETGLSERAVITNIQLAVDAGFLRKRSRRLPGQQWRRSEYAAIFPKDFDLVRAEDFDAPDAFDEQEGGEPNTEGGEPKDVEVVHQLPINLQTNPQENSISKKKINKKKAVMLLAEWEDLPENGRLRVELIDKWILQAKLDRRSVHQLIEEFRVDMGSKGKMYADFKLAFMNYLMKGWLSKRMDQIPAVAADGSANSTTRGHSL